MSEPKQGMSSFPKELKEQLDEIEQRLSNYEKRLEKMEKQVLLTGSKSH